MICQWWSPSRPFKQSIHWPHWEDEQCSTLLLRHDWSPGHAVGRPRNFPHTTIGAMQCSYEFQCGCAPKLGSVGEVRIVNRFDSFLHLNRGRMPSDELGLDDSECLVFLSERTDASRLSHATLEDLLSRYFTCTGMA